MAEYFLFCIAEGIIKKLGSTSLREVGLAWGVKEELLKLEGTLTYIKAVLLDAESQLSKSHELRLWMELLKDVCYSINDVFDDFEVHALQKQVLGRSFGGKVRNFCSSSTNPILFRHRMGRRIKEINKKLDKIAADRDRFNLKEGEQDRQIISREKGSRGTYSSLGKSKVIGREAEKENIVNLLLAGSKEHEGLDVLPVVGIGGLGKTMLAKMVYNDERLTEHFQLKGWVCVSEDFSLYSLLRKMVKALSGTSCDDLEMEQLVARLQQILEGQKFFLVLDDLWNEDRVQWEEVTSLLIGANGSKVLVTTRNHSIATMVGTLPCEKLKSLPHEDSVSLFMSWAFKPGEEMIHGNLMSIGKEIVRKCKGVPLAIRTLGSLLYMKTDEREWLSIRDNEMWRMEQKEGDILHALRLSYNLLPSHLKQCFAHLSTYPKDCVIRNRELIGRWIALGFVESTDQTEELEEVGMKYIHELFSRSFFEEVIEVEYYFLMTMHDLVHDLALLVAQNEYAVVDFHVKDAPRKVRHLAFCDNQPFPKAEVPSCFLGLKDVRSVCIQFGDRTAPNRLFADFCISRFKYLRILILPYSILQALPQSIGGLKHLRYLDMRWSVNINLLPASLCKLVYLEALVLHGCIQLRTLPKEFGNLVRLRILTITVEETCFPAKAFKCLASLRALYIRSCNNLQHMFDDDTEIWMQKSLTNLNTLVIMECQMLASLPSGLRYLTALENLVLHKCRVLDLMTDTQGNMIQGDGSELRLQMLHINGLPKVVCLPKWLIQGAANTLHELLIVDCLNITNFPETFTSLQVFGIYNCPQLTFLPDEINSHGTLKEVHIFDCPELIRRCQRDRGEDWAKISSVPEIYLDSRINIQNLDSRGEKKWFESKAYLKVQGSIHRL